MGFHIYSSIVCNTVGFPSNKGEKAKTIKIEANKVANKYTDIGIAVLRPTVDRIQFGFDLNADFLKQFDPYENLEEYRQKIKSDLFATAKSEPENGLSLIEGVNFNKPPYSGYNVHLKFQPAGASEPIRIQVDPKNIASKSFWRVDMKPNTLNDNAIQAFRDLVENTLLLPGEKYPSYTDFLRWSKITAIELNVDILGTRPHDLEVTNLKGKKLSPAKSQKYKGKSGRTQTIYPNVKKGTNTEYIYDKLAERIEAGEQPQYDDVLHSRFECRMVDQYFYKLANGKSRFNRIGIRALDLCKLQKLELAEQLFVRLALEQSVARALKLIPDARKDDFSKAFESVMTNIWDAKSLWDHWIEHATTSPLLSMTDS